MTIKEKLEAIKATEEKNRAVDQAFILGQQSVQPMREFNTYELNLITNALYLAEEERVSTFSGDVANYHKALVDKIEREINRREEH